MNKNPLDRNKLTYILKFSAYFSICVGLGWSVGFGKNQTYLSMALNFIIPWGISSFFLIGVGLACDRVLNNQAKKAQLPYEGLEVESPFGAKLKKLKFEYEFRDYLEANRFYMHRQLGFWYGLIVISLFDVTFGVIVYFQPYDFFSWLLLVFFLALPVYSHFSLPIKAKRLFQQQKQLHGPQEFELKTGQISSKNSKTQESHKWFLKALFDDRFLLLFNTPRNFIILPRRVFISDQQYTNWIIEARKLVQES